LDLSQELEENENEFFDADNERYFHLVSQRVETLYDIASSLVVFSIQIRDFYQTQMDVKQNNTIALLTIISTIFMPLTLIAGWYGMNFKYMPELQYKWAYPAVIVLSIGIVIGSIILFKKKKWL
jgi:magnesium transporter